MVILCLGPLEISTSTLKAVEAAILAFLPQVSVTACQQYLTLQLWLHFPFQDKTLCLSKEQMLWYP